MDFRTIFQLRNKKVWWIDVIFYLVLSLLLATVICYLVFLVKNSIQREQISGYNQQLEEVGTSDQKRQEAEVLLYRKKISDFTDLIKNHEFVSNLFVFFQEKTQPSVWINQFSLDQKGAKVQITGVAEDLDSVGRQTATLEGDEYIKSLSSLTTSLAENGKSSFSFNLSFDEKIFGYLLNSKNKKLAEEARKKVAITSSIANIEPEEQPQEENQEEGSTTPKSSEKNIYSFDVILPVDQQEIVGSIDQINHKVLFNFPANTDVSSLVPIIIISEKATIYPQSDVPQDFSKNITYQVTAEDGTTQSYLVVSSVPQAQVSQEPAKESKISVIAILLIVSGCAFLFIVILIIVMTIKNKKKISKIQP